MQNNNQLLVSTDWLADHLDNHEFKIFDATYFLTDKTRDPAAECAAEHIPGAQFFDITTIADTTSEWPNTLPSATQFASSVEAMGVSNSDQIIVYDRLGLFSAARVWWMFRYFGHDQVAVLDGGLPKWKNEQRPLSAETPSVLQGKFETQENKHFFQDVASLLPSVSQWLDNHEPSDQPLQLIDARSNERFCGLNPEPRKGLRSGHIPGSVNLAFQHLLNDDHTFKSTTEIQALFKGTGINIAQPITTTCGSGVTACILALGLAQIGQQQVSVFDGSWTEWGSNTELPLSTREL